MANKFVRSTRDVKDVNKLSDNVGDENDIFSQTDGKVFIKKRDGGYLEIGGGDVDALQKAIDEVKKAADKNKTDISTVKKQSDADHKDVATLKTQATDFETRIKALENPPTTE